MLLLYSCFNIQLWVWASLSDSGKYRPIPNIPIPVSFKPHLWFNFFNFGALTNILHYITKPNNGFRSFVSQLHTCVLEILETVCLVHFQAFPASRRHSSPWSCTSSASPRCRGHRVDVWHYDVPDLSSTESLYTWNHLWNHLWNTRSISKQHTIMT